MKNVALAVFVPTYDFKIYIQTVASLNALQDEARERKIGYSMFFFPGDAVIQRVRNACAAKFLSDKRFTHMLFVDADVEFSPATVMRMIKFDEPVTCAAYPKKHYRPEMPRGFVPRDVDHAHRASLDYVVTFEDPGVFEGKAKPAKVVNGFTPVTTAGAGLLLIRRDALQKMIAQFPDLRYHPGSGYYAKSIELVTNWYGFFDPFITQDTRDFLGEDVAFCYRWRECGGEIWCDLEATLTHHGYADFKGSLQDTLAIRQNAQKATQKDGAPART
jgi:hypothetical protein